MSDQAPRQRRPSPFPKTRWTLILTAGSGSGEDARKALQDLLKAYEYPLYLFLRRWPLSPEDARDELQEFYVHMIEHSVIRAADPARGRFRNFLIRSLKNHVLNRKRHAMTDGQGGGEVTVSIESLLDDNERRAQAEPATALTPEQVFERAWACEVVARAIDILRQEYVDRGDTELFDALIARVDGDPDAESYEEISRRLGKEPQALRTAASRLRARLRDCMRSLVADTLDDDADIEAEISYLMNVLGRPPSSL